MSGILVGADGSGYSQHALEWAAREAAIRHTSLTVLTVHQAVHGWAGTLYFQDDEAQTQKAAEAGRHKLQTRLCRGRKDRKRMAELAAVYDCSPVVRSPADIMARDQDKPKAPAPTSKSPSVRVRSQRYSNRNPARATAPPTPA